MSEEKSENPLTIDLDVTMNWEVRPRKDFLSDDQLLQLRAHLDSFYKENCYERFRTMFDLLREEVVQEAREEICRMKAVEVFGND